MSKRVDKKLKSRRAELKVACNLPFGNTENSDEAVNEKSKNVSDENKENLFVGNPMALSLRRSKRLNQWTIQIHLVYVF